MESWLFYLSRETIGLWGSLSDNVESAHQGSFLLFLAQPTVEHVEKIPTQLAVALTAVRFAQEVLSAPMALNVPSRTYPQNAHLEERFWEWTGLDNSSGLQYVLSGQWVRTSNKHCCRLVLQCIILVPQG